MRWKDVPFKRDPKFLGNLQLGLYAAYHYSVLQLQLQLVRGALTFDK